MHFLDEPTVRRVLSSLLRDEDTPLSLLTHAHPLPHNPYVFAERWIDCHGNTYLIDTDRNVRAMDTPPSRYHRTWSSRDEEHFGLQKLRFRAETITHKLIPHFEKLQPRLHPFESHFKKTLYTFRWEQAGIVNDFEYIPSLLITLSVDGRLIRMENSLSDMSRSLPTPQLLHGTSELFSAIEFMEEQTETRTPRREEYNIA